MKRRRAARLGLLFLTAVLVVALIILYITMLNGSGQKTHSVSGLRLSEVMSSNKGSVSDPKGKFYDYIELYNDSDEELNISGCGVGDDIVNKGNYYVFPQGTVIEAYGFIIVYCSGEAETGGFYAPFKISSGEEIMLTDSSGIVLDSIALRAVAQGKTLSRDMENDTWSESDPSPGYPNTPEGIAQYLTSIEKGEDIGVYINEFMASNATTIMDKYGVYSDWMELFNTNDHEVDISGCGVSDDINRPMRFTFPEGTIIPARGCLLIFLSGNEMKAEDTELHAPFSLRAYKEDVVFCGTNGRIIDSYSYEKQEADKSMARTPDGTGEFQMCASPTPGFPNDSAGQQAFAQTQTTTLGDIIISEVIGSNSKYLETNGEYPDAIEILNRSSVSISLKDYALSNNPKNPAMWVFPDVSIAPGEYKVILATGLDKRDPSKTLDTNFAISASGEILLLFDPQGKLVDKLQASFFIPDVSYGRQADGSTAYFTVPTLGQANGEGKKGITMQPQFLTLPGIYDGATAVELKAGEGESIFYTTDCTTPTTNSTKYSGPISVQKNTVIRAVAFKDGYITGQSNSGTFLLKTDNVNHSLPVLALTTDPKNLWDGKTGIYVYGDSYNPNASDPLLTANFYKGKYSSEAAQKEWERPACFEVFDGSGKQVFSQNIGLRIAGSFGRVRAQKGFNIIARSEYGQSRMAYKFFDNLEFTDYKALVLRAGAQDQARAKMRDELSAGLVLNTELRFLTQEYKPYVLYLNGEYWGVYFMKEKRNRFFVAQHENIEDSENMTIMNASTKVNHGTKDEWVALMAYVNSHDLSNADNYKYVTDRVDVDSFMDYMVCEIYVANSDYANIQYYKLPNGKWKWIYFDFCWGWNSSSDFPNASHPTLTMRRKSTNAGSDLLNALLKNAKWKDAFCRRMAWAIKNIYTDERVNAKIDELYAALEPEIRREREKFNQSTFMGGQQPAVNLGSYDGFVNNVNGIRNFQAKRAAVVKANFKAELGLSDSYMSEVFG